MELCFICIDRTQLFLNAKDLVLEISAFCPPFYNGVYSFLDNNTHPTVKLHNLFIAQSHDTKHIVPYLLGLVACSAYIIASF